MNAQPLTKHQESTTLQNSLQRAILSVSDKIAIKPTELPTIMKPNAAAANTELPMLIPRVDLLNSPGLFLAHTYNREAKTLQYWDMKPGSKPRIVSKAFYDSTLPITDREQSTKMVQEYSKEFGAKEVVLRARLVKASAPEADTEGKAEKIDLNAFLDKLQEALIKTIDSMRV